MKYLDDIRNFYEDHSSRGEGGFCAVIGFVDIDGNSYIDKEATYCHAGLNLYKPTKEEMNGVDVKKLTEVLSVKFDSFDFIEDKNDKFFTKWLTEDSPWKDCFLSKGEEVNKTGVYRLSVNQPSNLMTGAAIATRFISEVEHSENNAKLWQKFINNKVEPNLAFLLAHKFKLINDLIYENTNTYHFSIHPRYVDEDYYIRFLTNSPTYFDKPYINRLSYGSISDTWGKNDTHHFDQVLMSLPVNKKVDEVKNIFSEYNKRAKNNSGYDVKDVKQIADLVEEHLNNYKKEKKVA